MGLSNEIYSDMGLWAQNTDLTSLRLTLVLSEIGLSL